MQVFDLGSIVDREIAHMQVESAALTYETLQETLSSKPDHGTPPFNEKLFDSLFECFSATTILFKYLYTIKYGDDEYMKRGNSILSYSAESFAEVFGLGDVDLDQIASDMISYLNHTLHFFVERLKEYPSKDQADVIAHFYSDISGNICHRLLVSDSKSILSEKLIKHFMDSPCTAQLI